MRDYPIAEYHPRSMLHLYNQTIRTHRWRMTFYPEHEDWGELFDLDANPYEHHKLFFDPPSETSTSELAKILRRDFAPHPVVPKRISKW